MQHWENEREMMWHGFRIGFQQGQEMGRNCTNQIIVLDGLVWQNLQKRLSQCLEECEVLLPGFIFHRFLDITNKWIWRILEFRKKSLSLGKKSLSLGKNSLSLGRNSLSLGGKFWSFIGKLSIFALKLYKNWRIFEFRFEICLSLEKISS